MNRSPISNVKNLTARLGIVREKLGRILTTALRLAGIFPLVVGASVPFFVDLLESDED